MATTQVLLEEARAAYHALSTGTLARVVVDQDGQRVEFVAANRAGLYSYIKELEGKLSPPIPACNGPARFFF